METKRTRIIITCIVVCFLTTCLFSAEKENTTLEDRVLVLETKVKMLEERLNSQPAQQKVVPVKLTNERFADPADRILCEVIVKETGERKTIPLSVYAKDEDKYISIDKLKKEEENKRKSEEEQRLAKEYEQKITDIMVDKNIRRDQAERYLLMKEQKMLEQQNRRKK